MAKVVEVSVFKPAIISAEPLFDPKGERIKS